MELTDASRGTNPKLLLFLLFGVKDRDDPGDAVRWVVAREEEEALDAAATADATAVIVDAGWAPTIVMLY
jgi:hypothetical protein